MNVAELPQSAVGPLPPWAQLCDFLPKLEHDQLLDWILSNEKRFVPATVIDGVGGGNAYDAGVRSALKLRDLGPLGETLRLRLIQALPELMNRIGSKPPAPQSLEPELAAYGAEGHFSPHIDMAVGPGRQPLGARPGEDRVISAVYYLHSSPKRFSGGKLRLYRFGASSQTSASSENAVEVEPLDNSLVAFPSWATHEVRPVDCPSGEFRDYRFSLNCWYCRTLAAPVSD